jgi:hypothetical protein
MKRILHHDLARGAKAQRVALILLAGLLLTLAMAVYDGVIMLRA